MNTNFFSSVDKHNIERFHSECISWIFDNYNNIAIKFISSITKEEDIKIISVKTEQNYIDIEIRYQCNGAKKKLIIENKIKSTEHFINGYSQTEHYYNREPENKNVKFVYLTRYLLHRNQITKTHNISQELDEIEFDFSKQNVWRNKVVINPWTTMSYETLFNIFKDNSPSKKSKSDIILNEYIDYLEKWNYNSEKYLKFKKEINGDTQGYNYLYFTLLFNLLLVKIKKEKLNILNYYPYPNTYKLDNIENCDAFYYYFKSGSANSSYPLFAIFKRIKLNEYDKTLFKILKSNKKIVTIEYLNIGIQVQGDVAKYYTSIDDEYYDYVTTIDSKEYMKYCDKYFEDEILKKISVNFKSEKPNNCKTKTFYSRSFNMKEFETNDIKSNLNFISELIINFLKITTKW
jgi:hypothetical protein